MVSTSSSCPIHGLWPRTRGRSVFSPEAGLNQHFGRGWSRYQKGVGGGSALAALVGGGGEAHPSISVITCFWEPGHKVQMASMLSPHDQGKGPWILLHVVSGPWTSLVAVHDKGQCKIAVCGRHNRCRWHRWPMEKTSHLNKNPVLGNQIRIRMFFGLLDPDPDH
jgi:hypothetical protein